MYIYTFNGPRRIFYYYIHFCLSFYIQIQYGLEMFHFSSHLMLIQIERTVEHVDVT